MLETPALRRAAVSLSAGAFVWLLFAVAGSWVPVRQVTASGSYDAEHAPERASDGLTQETPNGSPSWLLPDRQTGSIQFTFDGEQRLDEIQLLNSRNRLYFDRATDAYRLAVVDAQGAHEVARGKLPPYPEWTTIPLDGRVATGAILYVDSFHRLGGGLAEVAFRPARGLWSLLFALLAAALTALAYPRLATQLCPTVRPKIVLTALLLALAAWGMRTLHFHTAVSAFEWLLLFDVKDFTSWRKAWQFLWELRIPIPAWLALLEIATQRLTGSIDFVSRDLYRFSIVGAHMIAVALAYPSLARMLATAAIAALCIAASAIVHAANPQIYDTMFGLTMITFVGMFAAATRTQGWWRAGLLAGAGLALSLWSMTRPFAIMLLPLPVVFALVRFPAEKKRGWLLFLAPVVLISGLWNAQLFLRHGQLGMSNHSGFNLERAWPMVPMPPLLPEHPSDPYRRGENNPEHIRNSKARQHAVTQWIVAHPGDALLHVTRRLVAVLDARTDFPGRHAPMAPVVAPYQLVVRLLMALALLSAVARMVQLARGATDLRVSDLSLVLLAGTIGMIAIGEVGEESRFVISFLPLLVSLLASADLVPRRFPAEASCARRAGTAPRG